LVCFAPTATTGFSFETTAGLLLLAAGLRAFFRGAGADFWSFFFATTFFTAFTIFFRRPFLGSLAALDLSANLPDFLAITLLIRSFFSFLDPKDLSEFCFADFFPAEDLEAAFPCFFSGW